MEFYSSSRKSLKLSNKFTFHWNASFFTRNFVCAQYMEDSFTIFERFTTSMAIISCATSFVAPSRIDSKLFGVFATARAMFLFFQRRRHSTETTMAWQSADCSPLLDAAKSRTNWCECPADSKVNICKSYFNLICISDKSTMVQSNRSYHKSDSLTVLDSKLDRIK